MICAQLLWAVANTDPRCIFPRRYLQKCPAASQIRMQLSCNRICHHLPISDKPAGGKSCHILSERVKAEHWFGFRPTFVYQTEGKKFGTRFWYRLLVSAGVSPYRPHAGPCRGVLVGMATRGRSGRESSRQGKHGAHVGWRKGNTPSKRRTMRNDEEVSDTGPPLSHPSLEDNPMTYHLL